MYSFRCETPKACRRFTSYRLVSFSISSTPRDRRNSTAPFRTAQRHQYRELPADRASESVQFNHILGRRIGWEVIFDDDKLPIVIARPGRPNDPYVIGAAPGTPAPLRIEFTVVPTNVQPLLVAQPPEVRFTYNLHDPSSTFPATVEAVNVGTTSIDVTAIGVGGADAALVLFTPTRPTPQTLASGVPLPFQVTLTQPVTSLRSISATGGVAYNPTDTGAQPSLLSIPIEIYADDPGLYLLPASLNMRAVRECGQIDMNAAGTVRERNALLTNNYAEPMEIQALTLEGADAGSFRIEEHGDPRVVASGGSFVFTVHHQPAAGTAHAGRGSRTAQAPGKSAAAG